ncbi:MAG: DUF58 domain-containing protein [Deltaproteobacteria bacterium]|nr:DUF58 domain-containing protein [Deltaproteobacteria bacterium]
MLTSRAFDPEFLQRLDALVFGIRRARTVRAGRRTVGRVLGSGIEPENFREYSAGDDLRFLDWNAFARLDDLTIRTFRAERQLELTIMIDVSASMAVPESDDKLGLAVVLGAALAYIGMGENDSVRLAAFSGSGPRLRLRTTRFHQRRESFFAFRPFVDVLTCEGETGLSAAAADLLHAPNHAGIVVLLSDFLVSSPDYEDALAQLVAARHEVKAIHVLGDRECTGAYPPGAYRVRDCETGELREVTFGSHESEMCRRRVEEHAARLSNFCDRHGIVYCRAFGASNLEAIMSREFPRLGVIA